jgi:hypothetical protein
MLSSTPAFARARRDARVADGLRRAAVRELRTRTRPPRSGDDPQR